MFNPVNVEPRDGYTIWLQFADGVEGELDISHWVERPYFASLQNREVFERVHISDHDSISWGFVHEKYPDIEVETCDETSYARLLGISLETIREMDWEELYDAIDEARKVYNLVKA